MEYDPKIHLHEDFLNGVLPKSYSLNGYEFSYSESFRILSDEGIRVLKSIIDENKSKMKSFGVGDRAPKTIRNMGYSNKFIKDFNECPVILEKLSKIANEKLKTHNYISSYSHVNIGPVGADLPIDQWHCDSVPYVMVILLSDMSGATGGELEMIKLHREKGFDKLKKGTINEDDLERAKYPGIGYAIFMKGSQMIHHVTAVKNGKEPRITVVNSYMPVDPFIEDETRLAIFKNEPETCYKEYSIHKMKIAIDQLKENEKQNCFTIDFLKNAVEVLEGKDDSHIEGMYFKSKL